MKEIDREMLESLWLYSRELRDDALRLREQVRETSLRSAATRDQLGLGRRARRRDVEEPAVVLTKA